MRALVPFFFLPLIACGGDEQTSATLTPPAAAPAPAVQTDTNQPAPPQLPIYSYTIVDTFPHETDAFTQGLFVHQGILYESTGRVGQSRLIRHDIMGGATPRTQPLAQGVFGEGSVAVGDRIIALTWRDRIGLIHDLDTLEPLGTFPLAGEGWGLTFDGTHLIVSDGTNRLRFLDPETYTEIDSIEVYVGTRPAQRLNELEYINGEVWANIWQTDTIVRINPNNGQVSGFIDLTGLHPDRARPADDVLNGIAYDPAADRLFVTGKNWSQLYEIELTAR